MKNYWVISPYDSSPENQYESAWKFCLRNNTISVGHTVPTNLKDKTEEEFYEIVIKYYYNKTPAWQTRKFNMLWQFYNEIKPDDIIIARKGLSFISGIGTIKKYSFL